MDVLRAHDGVVISFHGQEFDKLWPVNHLSGPCLKWKHECFILRLVLPFIFCDMHQASKLLDLPGIRPFIQIGTKKTDHPSPLGSRMFHESLLSVFIQPTDSTVLRNVIGQDSILQCIWCLAGKYDVILM